MICLAVLRLCSLNQPREQVSKPARDEGYSCPVRWKLVIITSLVAALVNAGGMHALSYWIARPGLDWSSQRALGAGLIIILLSFITLAAVFVYRHTARRRKLQALVTVLFSITLTFTALYAVTLIFDRTIPPRPPITY